jgi:hypothetical protein
MEMVSPRCPRCIDGGQVQLIDAPDQDSTIFQPRPGDEPPRQAFLCNECGWTMPVEKSSSPQVQRG